MYSFIDLLIQFVRSFFLYVCLYFVRSLFRDVFIDFVREFVISSVRVSLVV